MNCEYGYSMYSIVFSCLVYSIFMKGKSWVYVEFYCVFRILYVYFRFISMNGVFWLYCGFEFNNLCVFGV